jgi:hypothetical protein
MHRSAVPVRQRSKFHNRRIPCNKLNENHCLTSGNLSPLRKRSPLSKRAAKARWTSSRATLRAIGGELSEDDRRENQFSLEKGFRLLSSYRTTAGDRLWVITEANRSHTTLLLPDEY